MPYALVLYGPIVLIFVNSENGIPIDFQEIIALVAPRPVLIIALR
jgi:hypothetical protein